MIDAARIKTVLEPFARLNTIHINDGKRIYDLEPGERGQLWLAAGDIQNAAALFRDLDAQGPKRTNVVEYHVPTVEACGQLAFDQQCDKPEPGTWNDACIHIANTLRAKAQVRDPKECQSAFRVIKDAFFPDRGASTERPLDKTDAWDEEHIKRRSIIQTPEGFKAIDRETTRALSECRMRTVSAFNEPAADAGEMERFKPRATGFLSEDNIDHEGEIFDYIVELHQWLWKFTNAITPGALGSINDCAPKALASLRPAPSEEQVDLRGPVEQQMAKLREKYPDASIISERYSHLVTVPKLGLPPGWDRANIDVKFVIPAGYPQASPRDFWASPLHPAHGGSPRGTDTRPKPGIPSDWRRFMWAPTKWNPNSDDLLTFVNVIRRRLSWVV